MVHLKSLQSGHEGGYEMKKKRILALALTFVLVCSNYAWADTGSRPEHGLGSEYASKVRTASSSNAEKDENYDKATDSNAQNKATRSNALLMKWDESEKITDIVLVNNYHRYVQIKWNVSGSYQCNLYRSEDGSDYIKLESGTWKRNYTDKTAEKGKTYQYKVTAVKRSSDETQDPQETEGRVLEVVASDKEILMQDQEVTVGITGQVKITFSGFEEAPEGVWRSDNGNVISITQEGVFTAKKRGRANLFFQTADGYEVSCKYLCYDEMVPPSEDMYTSREWTVFRITNQNRMKEGHLPLSMVPLMQTGTDIRKKELTQKYSHIRPDGSSCFTVFNEIGYTTSSMGENIAWGYSSPAAVMNGWMHSSGHYKNIMNDNFVHFATGESNNYWVQMFSGCYDDKLNHMELFVPADMTFKKASAIEDFGVVAALNCTEHGISYMPVISQMCTGYDANQEGQQTITVKYKDLEASFTVTIKGGSSSNSGGGSGSGGGGSHSYGSGGSSSGGGGSSAGGTGKGPGAAGISGAESIPDYVVKGDWTQTKEGGWRFTDSNGMPYLNQWAAVYNPYANPTSRQNSFDWFFFDANGNMVTGWYQDGENLFYLNQNSDGTRGKMVTGWCWVPDQNGVQKCYYFNPNSDGTRGKMMRNGVIDGNTVNENGEWTVNGVVQTK